MPQESNVLYCISCKTYQAHIVKKSKKWQCKICNFKQVFRQAYFQGSGKDCRILVQELNFPKENDSKESTSFDKSNNDMSNESYINSPPPKRLKITDNKWERYSDVSDNAHLNYTNVSSNEIINFKNINSISSQDYENETSNNTENDCMNKNYNLLCDNDCTSSNYSLVHEDDRNQSFEKDQEKEDNSIIAVLKETIHNNDDIEITDIANETVTKSTNVRSIFDDDEDIDTTIDF